MPYYSFKDARTFNTSQILSQMGRLIRNRQDLPDEEQVINMIYLMLPLKQETIYNEIDRSNVAKYLVDFIPEDSIREIKRKADTKEPDALKELADCIRYGLKGERSDPLKAFKLYYEAADLNHPEAMTFIARNLYQTILMPFNMMLHEDIPQNKLKEIDRESMNKMWFFLENLAILDWISPFFVQQFQQAVAIKVPTKLPNMVLDAMDRRERGEDLDDLEAMHLPPCARKECFMSMADAEFTIHCNRCLLERYCSKRCQEIDWPRHKASCVRDPRANQPNANLIAVQKNMELDFAKLMDTNSIDPNRYTIELKSNHCQLLGRSKRTEITDKITEKLKDTCFKSPCDFLSEFSANWKADEAPARQILALARLKSMPIDQTSSSSLKKLTNKANRYFMKGHFVNAIKYLSMAIDIYLADKPIYKMQDQDKSKLVKLLAKRAQSNLELGKVKRSPTIVQRTIDDCIFLLESGIIEKEITNADPALFNSMQQTFANAKQDLISLAASANAEARHQSETVSQRRRRLNREAEEKKDKLNKQHQEVDACLTTELTESFLGSKQLAINAVDSDDVCPVCISSWSSFNEVKLVAILPCNHAVCIQCLHNYIKVFNETSQKDKEGLAFIQCPLCRLQLNEDILNLIVYAFAKRRPGDLLKDLAKRLPLMDGDSFNQLVVELLTRNDFNLDKTYDCLFNIVGLVEPRPDESLDSAEKQAFYVQARAPVNLLRAELKRMHTELQQMDTESEDGIKLEETFRLKQEELNGAIRNASRDIFERVNYRADSNGENCVDLHGLHVDEAKEIVGEYVLPVLNVEGKLMIVTGRGLHSKVVGTSQLKTQIKEYFKELKVRCEDVAGNDGAFYVFKS